MNLFVANVTAQNRLFHWRESENPKIFTLEIKAGEQIQVLRDKSPEIVNSVIDHAKLYSFFTYEEAKKATREGEKIILVYSIDKPLPGEVYALAVEINEDIANREMEIETEKAAYAIGRQALEDRTGLYEGVSSISVEIEEVKPKAPGAADKKLLKKTLTTNLKS